MQLQTMTGEALDKTLNDKIDAASSNLKAELLRSVAEFIKSQNYWKEEGQDLVEKQEKLQIMVTELSKELERERKGRFIAQTAILNLIKPENSE